MDSGISEMISGVLSNPDAINKIITMMPAVAQMMNSGGLKKEKIVETTVIDKNKPETPDNNISAESLMANENVMNALKNLISALNDASANNNNISENNENTETGDKPDNNDAVMTSANVNNNFENIVNMLGSALNSQNNQTNQDDSANINSGIEKTLDTLKNFSSATSPEGDHKSKLLLALKPFLKDDRKNKIDTAIKYMNAAKIINLFGKNGFV